MSAPVPVVGAGRAAARFTARATTGRPRAGGRAGRGGGAAPLALPLFAALLGAVAACSNNGRYTVSWAIAGSDGLSTAAACGRHGIAMISLAETEAGGAAGGIIVPCAPGTFTREVAPGRYTLALVGRDARGLVKETKDMTLLRASAEVVVAEGGAPARAQPDPVVLLPQPECRDAVDNDCDGRVDLDDAECLGEDGATEAAAAGGEGCPAGGGGGGGGPPDAGGVGTAPDAARDGVSDGGGGADGGVGGDAADASTLGGDGAGGSLSDAARVPDGGSLSDAGDAANASDAAAAD